MGAIEVISACLGFSPIALGGHPPRTFPEGNLQGVRILAAAETFEVGLRDTILPKLKTYMTPEMMLGKPKRNGLGIESTFKFKSGAELMLMSYQQHSAAFEGSQWDMAWFDEPPPQDIFNAVRRGCMARQAPILITATPLKEPWLWDELILPAQDPEHPAYGSVEHFMADMHSNCRDCNGGYLPHREITTYLASLPEHERAARDRGMFLDLQGVEFHYVHAETHVIEDFDIPRHWPIVEVCDPAMKRGLYLTWAACDHTDHWIVVHAAHIPNGSFSQMCKDLRRERDRFDLRPTVSIMDQRGGKHEINKADQTCWFDEFRKEGIIFHPSVDVPMETLHEWLRPKWDQNREESVARLRFLKRVSKIEKGPMWALERFQWDPTSSKPKQYRQAGKDWVDDLRYMAGHPGLRWQKMNRGQESQATPDLVRSYAVPRHNPNTSLRWNSKRRTSLPGY